MEISVKIIPQSEHRYPTCGDFYVDASGVRHVLVSDMGNDDYAFLVAIHEVIEQHLCLKRGITEESITDFDIEFEKNRKEGDESEPGDNINAPYLREHFFATNIERLVAEQLGVDWEEYNKAVMSL